MRMLVWSVLYVAAAMLILPRDQRASAASRVKRVIAFRKGSTFFYRLNYKINSIPTTTIFAQATGFKVAWQLPSGNAGRRYRRNVDDVHESAELLYERVMPYIYSYCCIRGLDKSAFLECQVPKRGHGLHGHGFDGKSCLAKHVCQALEYANGRDGALAKILKLLSKRSSTNATTWDPMSCELHSLRCPLELVGIDRFTEYR